jgi:hypothetical protein
MAEGTVWNRSGFDRAMASERKKQDHLCRNDSIGYQICEKQNPLVGFEDHFDDSSSLDNSDARNATG